MIRGNCDFEVRQLLEPLKICGKLHALQREEGSEDATTPAPILQLSSRSA